MADTGRAIVKILKQLKAQLQETSTICEAAA